MTRINCVPPSELCDQHLVAEYRELPRVFTLASRACERGGPKKLPDAYTMGKGHVLFFYDKLDYLKSRHYALVNEMLARGMRPSFPEPPAVDLGKSWRKNWTPDEAALAVNRARIHDRLADMAASGRPGRFPS